MPATLMPVEEVVVRWSTTEQFEMRIPRTTLLEMLADDDELPDGLDDLGDEEISDLFDSDELANSEGNEDGNYIGTIDRTIDSIEIMRAIPAEYAHFVPGQQVRVIRELNLSLDAGETDRMEWVGTIVNLDGSGVTLQHKGRRVHMGWVSSDPEIGLSFVAVDDDIPALADVAHR